MPCSNKKIEACLGDELRWQQERCLDLNLLQPVERDLLGCCRWREMPCWSLKLHGVEPIDSHSKES